MQHFKNILVVIDSNSRNEITLERAVGLSHRNQAWLTVATVVEKLPHGVPMLFTSTWLNSERKRSC
ncbi:MAG: universal stress protein [Anaerolineae bacterium]|nr:universal stress protein [Anaerolineae bacterium]